MLLLLLFFYLRFIVLTLCALISLNFCYSLVRRERRKIVAMMLTSYFNRVVHTRHLNALRSSSEVLLTNTEMVIDEC